MSKTIREIYRNLIQEIDEDELSCTLKKEILELLGDAESYPDMQTYERCRDKAFRIAGSGEEAGFCRGFQYALQLFMECR